MKVTLFECEDWMHDYLTQRLPDDELVFVDGVFNVEKTPSDTDILSVFVDSRVRQESIDKLPNLKLITTRTTGFDHIDHEYAKSKGVPVSNVPYYGENTVAEHTFALLLAISRKMMPSMNRVRSGSFNRDSLRGFDLRGKRVGIIGGGHIGVHFARMCKGFEMDVTVYDPFPKHEIAEEIGFRFVGLDELVRESDVISLHCPYNDHTHHILNADNLQHVKSGVVVLNTARGKLIDSSALYQAILDDRVGFAGLDVLEEECHVDDDIEVLSDSYSQSCDMHKVLVESHMMHHPRILITPHNAFNSEEAVRRILDTTVDNIKLFASGEPSNLVK